MIFEKIKTLFSQPQKKIVKKSYWEADNGFDLLISDLNTYFNVYTGLAEEYKTELSFLNSAFEPLPDVKKIAYAIIPYSFTLGYDYRPIDVFKCTETEMNYVYLEGKKLFFPKLYTQDDIRKNFTFLQVEQDERSPHRYLDTFFDITENDTVADIGAAEGNFSLSIVEKAKKLIIVEGEPIWKEALEKTFEPWKNKVIFVHKMISSDESDQTVSLSKLCNEHGITAIKMDIEGSELSVLKTASNFISNRQLKMAITTYHNGDDAERIKRFLEDSGHKTIFSNGQMLFVHDQLKPPFFRKALIKTIISSTN